MCGEMRLSIGHWDATRSVPRANIPRRRAFGGVWLGQAPLHGAMVAAIPVLTWVASLRPIVGARINPRCAGRDATQGCWKSRQSCPRPLSNGRDPKCWPGGRLRHYPHRLQVSQAVCVFVVACIGSYPILALRGGRGNRRRIPASYCDPPDEDHAQPDRIRTSPSA